MRNLHEWLYHLANALDTDMMELVIWGVIAGVVCMSFLFTAVLWKQAKDDEPSN